MHSFCLRGKSLAASELFYVSVFSMEKQMCGYVGLLSVMWISVDNYICMQSVYIFVSVSIFSPVPLHQ